MRNSDWRYWPDGLIKAMRKTAGWLHLTLVGWVALFAALLAIAAASVGLLAVSHDVLDRGGLARRDPSNLNAVVHLRSGWSVEASRIVTQFGSVGVLLALAAAAGVLLWWRGARLGVVLAPLVALGLAASVVTVLKPLVNRARPPLPLHLVTEGEPSFPSGHSTDSTALLLTIGLLVAVVVVRRPLARVVLVGASGLAAVLVGLSRLILGVHWPTDVLAGWTLGAVVGLLVTTVVLALPATTPGPPEGARRLAHAWWRLERVANVRRSRAHPDPRAS
ncbi:MAG TPA: phosphatase PAP2 family protein [Acidimicrobiales bacterium]